MLPQVECGRTEVAWNYDLEQQENRFQLILNEVVYPEYWAAINRISTPQAERYFADQPILSLKVSQEFKTLDLII